MNNYPNDIEIPYIGDETCADCDEHWRYCICNDEYEAETCTECHREPCVCAYIF